MDAVTKIVFIKEETVYTNRMIMFGASTLCGYDIEGKLFHKNLNDVVAIDMVKEENKIPVANFHALPEKK